MKIAITGGNGFIGSNLARMLQSQGHEVRVLIRQSSDLSNLHALDLERRIADVRNPEELHVALRGIELVFHTAAIVSFWKPRRQLQFEVNVLGTRNVVQACIDSGVRRLVHTSSIAALGYPEERTVGDETTEFNWQSYENGYKNSKHFAELEILHGIDRGLDAVMVNPSVVIGPGDIHFNGGSFIRSVAKGFVPFYIKGGTNIAYVDDVVRGHIAAGERGVRGHRYILGGENMTHRQMLQTIAAIVGSPAPRLPLPVLFVKGAAKIFDIAGMVTGKEPMITSELISGAGKHVWYSSAKAERELSYTITPFREAVERTYRWYKERNLL
jgi:dihydroflavonol-4-reductase